MGSGWNTEFGRKKMSVNLGESDLRRILRQVGLGERADDLTVREAEELLYLEAEEYAQLTLARHDPSMKDEIAVAIRELRVQKVAQVAKIKKRLFPEETPKQDE
jgi:hypothetical protein